ncbi:MAG: hypothetical protein U9Q62_08525 [Campylobacterota bacterium]|nr:hypothetical protein [Campylobacterota bacterium]
MEPADVLNELNEAVSEHVILKPSEEVDTFLKNNKIYFSIRDTAKVDNGMGVGAGSNDGLRIVNLEKAPDLYEQIIKSFEKGVAEASAHNQYTKAKRWTRKIVTGKISRATKQGFFVNTPIGQGFCSKAYHVAKEQVNGLYKKDKEMDFEVRSVSYRSGKVQILLARRSNVLARRVADDIFFPAHAIKDVQRVPGKYTKIVLDKKPTADLIQKARYRFGGERIIIKTVAV